MCCRQSPIPRRTRTRRADRASPVSFSYTLFLALLLLAPGLAVWAGFRFGERPGLISQAPERPGSTVSLFIIVFGALLGHLMTSAGLVMQGHWCRITGLCLPVPFDPNVYREILSGGRGAVPTDGAVFTWFLEILLPAVAVGLLSFWASRWPRVRTLREQVTFGWLKPWVDLARPGDSFMLAYVVTSLAHEGAHVAYEGWVESIALDDQRAIAMIVLRDSERFLVRVTASAAQRVSEPQRSLPLMQIAGENIANVVLEVFRAAPIDQRPVEDAA